MSRGKRLVDGIFIQQRMNQKDARMAREMAARQRMAEPRIDHCACASPKVWLGSCALHHDDPLICETCDRVITQETYANRDRVRSGRERLRS